MQCRPSTIYETTVEPSTAETEIVKWQEYLDIHTVKRAFFYEETDLRSDSS